MEYAQDEDIFFHSGNILKCAGLRSICPDTYTIFIIEKDFYGQGKAVYPIERINLATGKFFVNLIKSPLQSVTGEVCEGMGGGWYGQGALPDFVSGAEPPHNLPTAAEVVRTVLPLE